jgi:hypothetical protein
VEEQVTEGNRVASRWILNGIYHGRAVVLRGITISYSGRTAERGKTEGTPTRSPWFANSV